MALNGLMCRCAFKPSFIYSFIPKNLGLAFLLDTSGIAYVI